MIRNPLTQFMLTADMEQVLRILAGDEIIEVAFNDPEMLEAIGRAFTFRANMLRTAETFGLDFDETLAHFEKEEQTLYEEDLEDVDIDETLNHILGE